MREKRTANRGVRTFGAALTAALLAVCAGCQSAGEGRVFPTVDLAPGQTLRYRFVSERKVALDWDPGAESDENRVQEQTERLEMVVAYRPVEVDPYGISSVRATCESVEATRGGQMSRRSVGVDAVETAQGKSFTLKIDPRGRIADASELEALIKDLGEKAFRPGRGQGRVKEPDMVGDFLASQWFLWDAVASVENAAEGLTVGQTWTSKLSVPTPMVIRKARDVVYRLAEVREADEGRVAVIESTYALAETVPSGWPVPYSGRFQMSGTFGFLGSYQVSRLDGAGEELFDLDAGRVLSRRQEYTMEMKASLPPLGIRANPHLKIDQTLTMELLEQ
jgi:hypothetical protein